MCVLWPKLQHDIAVVGRWIQTVLARDILRSVLGEKLEAVCYVERFTHKHTRTHIRLKGGPGGGKERGRGEVKENMQEKSWSEISIYLTLLIASKIWRLITITALLLGLVVTNSELSYLKTKENG